MPSRFSKYVAAHRAERARAEAALPALRARARAEAALAASRIGDRVGAERVLLFGSLARGSFGPGSDIDLAVEGLAPGRLVDAMAAAEEGCPFKIDIVPIHAARPELARRILEDGIVLWSR